MLLPLNQWHLNPPFNGLVNLYKQKKNLKRESFSGNLTYQGSFCFQVEVLSITIGFFNISFCFSAIRNCNQNNKNISFYSTTLITLLRGA